MICLSKESTDFEQDWFGVSREIQSRCEYGEEPKPVRRCLNGKQQLPDNPADKSGMRRSGAPAERGYSGMIVACIAGRSTTANEWGLAR